MATECKLDIHREVWDLEGILTAEVSNKEDPTDPVLHENQTLVVKVTVTLGGHILHYLCNTQIGVSIAFESCGRGPELDFCDWTTLDPCRTNVYVFTFEIPPGTLPAGHLGKQYELCITLGSKDCCGHVGFIFGTCKDINITVVPTDVNA